MLDEFDELPVDFWLTPEQLVRVYALMESAEMSYEGAAEQIVMEDRRQEEDE